MKPVVWAVNFIRSHALIHPQFQTFLKEIYVEYSDLSYHTAVRWLSCDKVLLRFYNLRKEINLSPTARVPNLWYAYQWWYAEAFQVVREMFSKNAKKVFVFTETPLTEKCSYVNLVSVHFLLLLNCNTCKFVHIVQFL